MFGSQLLAEATKKIFGSLSRESDALTMEEEESNAKGVSEIFLANDGNVPEWAQMLEPVRKLPTNVGTRIRKCVYEALEKNPPEWARKTLEHSISKEVYKGNASGPTKVLLSGIFPLVCVCICFGGACDIHGSGQTKTKVEPLFSCIDKTVSMTVS